MWNKAIELWVYNAPNTGDDRNDNNSHCEPSDDVANVMAMTMVGGGEGTASGGTLVVK